MEITRLQPFPLVFSHDGFTANTDYVIAIQDDHATDLVEISATSNSTGVLVADLPNYFARYDDEYRVEVYEKTGTDVDGFAIRGDMVMIDTLTIMRPYVDPDNLAETPEDLADAKMYEAIARAIINSITGGFMYKREIVETVGMGNDYLSMPFRLNKIVRVYENDVIVYDAEPADPLTWKNVRDYYISPDKGAITVNVQSYGGYNRMQSKPVVPQMPASDSFTLYNTNDSPNIIQNITGTPMFVSGWDYIIVVEVGLPIIPQDIKTATNLIVNDLKCNNIPYINSYITDYKSDQFTLKFDPDVFKDTGNRIADKILSAYVRPIYRLGVL
jgi:hypothetical protein